MVTELYIVEEWERVVIRILFLSDKKLKKKKTNKSIRYRFI